MNSKTLIATAIATVLFAGVAHTVENADGGQPISTPTWTVPVKPNNLTIKTKSTPPYAPIEDEKALHPDPCKKKCYGEPCCDGRCDPKLKRCVRAQKLEEPANLPE